MNFLPGCIGCVHGLYVACFAGLEARLYAFTIHVDPICDGYFGPLGHIIDFMICRAFHDKTYM